MAQGTEVRIGAKDEVSGTLAGIRGAFEKFRVSVETNNKGINKLDNSLRGLGAQAASLPGPLGRVADALVEFAPGGLVGAAYIAGIGAMILIGKSYYDSLERTKKLNEDFARTLADIQGIGKQFELNKIKKELDDLDKKQADFMTKFMLGSDGQFFGFGESFNQARTRLKTELLKVGDTIEDGIKAANQRANTAMLDLQMAFAERMGVGEIINVKQTKEAVDLAKAELKRLQDARKAAAAADKAGYDEQIRTAEAAVASTTAAQIRAETALANSRKTAAKDRLQAQQEEIKKYEEAGREQIKIFEATAESAIKGFEEQAKAVKAFREELRNTLNIQLETDIAASLKTVLQDVDVTLKNMENAATKAQEAAAERMKTIEPIVFGISDGFDMMVNGLMSGENAFLAFGKGARSAIAGILKALAQQNLVEGLGALGKAFAAAANPLTAPSAGGFFKSAAQHFAAAAAAGVGARAVGGAGGGGIGANGGAFNNSQLGRNNFNTQQPLTIVIQGGLLDMSNPDTVRSFTSALETVSSRRITINRVGA